MIHQESLWIAMRYNLIKAAKNLHCAILYADKELFLY